MTTPLSPRQRDVLALHFDPRDGSAYWRRRAGTLDFDPRRDIATVEDLRRFGPMDENALRAHPLSDFVPRRFHDRRETWVTGETGGTTGAPKATAYLEEEFQSAFVAPFAAAAQARDFPRGESWLWIGPGGPHVIGKAARLCARAMGSPDPFSVDFDPRWIKRFAPDSLGFRRYLDHVLEQAARVIQTQPVGVLFSTPAVFGTLPERLSAAERERVRGVHFGGMPVTNEAWGRVREAFPNSILLAGFGNTLFGMCPDMAGDPDAGRRYLPFGDRIVFAVAPEADDIAPREKIRHLNFTEGAGQLAFSRFDAGFLLLNQLEREYTILTRPNAAERAAGFIHPGLHDPRPLASVNPEWSGPLGLY